MNILIEARDEFPIDFELNSADEVVIVGEYKDLLWYLYVDECKVPLKKTVYTPKAPNLRIDYYFDHNFNVTFRKNGEVVVNGSEAEVIKEALKNGSPLDVQDERLYSIEHQIRMERELRECERKFKELEDERNHAWSDWKLGEKDDEPYNN